MVHLADRMMRAVLTIMALALWPLSMSSVQAQSSDDEIPEMITELRSGAVWDEDYGFYLPVRNTTVCANNMPNGGPQFVVLPEGSSCDPPLKPGTAIATFRPDKNGEIRYPQDRDKPREPRTRRHAGVFMGYGEQGDRKGIFVLDQFNGSARDPARDQGQARVRFYPFERRQGEGGYSAGEFSAIRAQRP